MAKLFVSETAVGIGLVCQRALGAYDLAEGPYTEHHMRDLLDIPIGGESSNMQENNITNRLGLASEGARRAALERRRPFIGLETDTAML